MRLPTLFPLAFAVAVLVAPPVPASDCAPARVEGAKVPFRPRAWSPPVARAVARLAPGMIEGDAVAEPGPGRSRAESLAGVVVELRPDGSRRAVLGGAIRAWSIATVDEQGRLRLDCASSEAAAKARVRAAGPRGGK